MSDSETETENTRPVVRKARDLGRVIDGRIRKSLPFVRLGGRPNTECLLHIPEFYRYLDTPVGRHDRCATPGDNCVFCAMRDLAREYWSNGEDESQQTALERGQQTTRRYTALDNLNTAMNNHPESYAFLESQSGVYDMNGSGQQDAHEYLLGLINMLKYENGRDHQIRNAELQRHFDLRKKAMNRLFHLRTKITWTCEDCHTVHVRRAKEPGINLKMPENPTEPTLEHYLDRHFEDATAEGLKCHSTACKGRARDREASTIIVGGPEILVIQLVRMSYKKVKGSWRAVKVKDEVEYGDRLDLFDYSNGRLSYQLNGVVAHSGKTLTEGHYVSMVRSQKGDGFVICNDDNIDDSKTKEQVLSLAEGKSFQSYLLIYQKTGGRMANCV